MDVAFKALIVFLFIAWCLYVFALELGAFDERMTAKKMKIYKALMRTSLIIGATGLLLFTLVCVILT